MNEQRDPSHSGQTYNYGSMPHWSTAASSGSSFLEGDHEEEPPQQPEGQAFLRTTYSSSSSSNNNKHHDNLQRRRSVVSSKSRRMACWAPLMGAAGWMLLCLVLVEHYHSSSGMFRSPLLFATQEEMDLAQWYSVSPWAIRQAQRQAREALRVLEEQDEDEDYEEEDVSEENASDAGRRYLKKKKKKSQNHHHDFGNDHNDPDAAPPLHEGCESTVIILRHCEKGTIKEHCAYEGFERSVYLASLFGNASHYRWPLPAAIFAEAPVGRNDRQKMNFRELETVGPLARAAGVEVDDSYSDDFKNLGRDILRAVKRGTLCGQTVVVVWKHSLIAHMARAMGCGPEQGCPVDYSGKTFDEVWQVRMVYRSWPHSSTHRFVSSDAVTPPKWKVFGSTQYEHFDPLAVSKSFGDYPPHGTATGGRWQKEKVAYPERQAYSDTAGWRMKRVGFPHQQAAVEDESKPDKDVDHKDDEKHHHHRDNN